MDDQRCSIPEVYSPNPNADTYMTPTARINSICFSLIGICAPILVSVSAFFVYVASGNELTIGTAFTVRCSARCMCGC